MDDCLIEILRVEEAIRRTDSEKLKRDYGKYLKKLKIKVGIYKKERG